MGRISYVHPSSGELFYLRMLLNIVKGPLSYEDIRTVDRILWPTFQQACSALGLLDDDKEWDHALQEAIIWVTPAQLRNLFATIVIFCEVADPRSLWNKFWRPMSKDIARRLQAMFRLENYHLPTEHVREQTLIALEATFNTNGSTLSRYNLPSPSSNPNTVSTDMLNLEELDYNIPSLLDEYTTLLRQLNPEQRAAYDEILAAVMSGNGGFFFVNGHGGTGKTFLWRAILAAIRASGRIVLAVASSGIA